MSKIANYYCSVPQCNSWKKRDPNLTFHQFPDVGKYRVSFQNKSGQFQLIDARKAWTIKLRIGKPISKFMKVCSLHFKEDDYFPIDLTSQIKRRVLKKTAVPSLKLPVPSLELPVKESDISLPSTSTSVVFNSERSERLISRNLRKEESHECMYEDHSSESDLEDDKRKVEEVVEYSDLDLEVANSLLQLKSGSVLKKSVDSSVQVNTPKIETISDLLKTDKDLSCFTGIFSLKILNVLEQAVKNVYKDQRSRRLSIRDRIILVFVKLKLNLSYTALSILFGSSEKLVKIYICDMIPILGKILRCSIPFSSAEEIKKNIPTCFAVEGFEDVRIILDCTEIFVQKAKCLCCRIRFYSQYKSSQTVKFMTGVSPGGLITFVSQPFGGRASDKIIFEKSGLINRLDSGIDKLMVDKGILIDDICLKHNIGLIRPPFLKKKKQLSAEESILNTKIAAARVHIERSNQRIKVFKILSEKLQWNLVPQIHDIFIIICGITNLSSPILANNRFITD